MSHSASGWLVRAAGRTRDYPLWAQYVLALSAAGSALLAQRLLTPWLGERFPLFMLFLTLLPMVLLVRPGPFLVAALGGWLGVWVLYSRPIPTGRVVVVLIVFLVGVVVAAFTSWLAQRSVERERRKDAMLRAFVDESPTSKWVTDGDGRIVYANKAMATAFGMPVQALLGRMHTDLLPHDLRATADANLREVVRHGQPRVSLEELRPQHGAGDRRTFEWRRFPLSLDDRGNVALVAGMAHDVTDKLDHERTLRASEARLVAALQERQGLLERERHARQEAEAATRVKDEFLATLSHELRTPLNAILGWVQLIERNPGQAQLVEEGLPVIARNARAQTSLIADLLDTSRIISGKLRLDMEVLDLAEVVHAAVDAVQSAAESKGVRIEKVVAQVACPVRGDAGRLQQVVWNLLSNAVKFTDEGREVEIALARNESTAQIVVRDSGQGISAEFLPHVFERFRQADSSMTRRFVGLGLGLSIVKHLVELHGGSVAVHSVGHGTGATFTVELPLALGPSPERSRPPAEVPDADLSGIKILAVEDQQDALELLQRVLEGRHAQVITARSVDAGLRALRAERPDIVLCDLGLPGKDGFEFIRELRASGDRTPAVALTAFARTEDQVRVLRAGYHTHIAKPFDAAGLASIVSVIVRSDTAESRTDGSKP